MILELEYGANSVVTLELQNSQLQYHFQGPLPDSHPAQSLQEALQHPIEYPALQEAVIPGDRITLVLNRQLSQLSLIVAEVMKLFALREIEPAQVTLLMPASWQIQTDFDPRQDLSDAAKEQIHYVVYDPTADERHRMFIGNLNQGERLYLSRDLAEADFILPISTVEFDDVLGYRDPYSLIYPGLSTVEAMIRSHGQGHEELNPDDERPLRQMAAEACWLLGIQMVLAVIPSCKRGKWATILSGMPDIVLQEAQQFLNKHWRIKLPARVENVVITLPAAMENNWYEVGKALAAARHVVAKGGNIYLLSDLKATLGPGFELLRESTSAAEAITTVRDDAPPDMIPALQWARAADWANIYLLSQLTERTVQELHCSHVEDARSMQKLIQQSHSVVVLEGAQHLYASIGSC